MDAVKWMGEPKPTTQIEQEQAEVDSESDVEVVSPATPKRKLVMDGDTEERGDQQKSSRRSTRTKNSVVTFTSGTTPPRPLKPKEKSPKKLPKQAPTPKKDTGKGCANIKVAP